MIPFSPPRIDQAIVDEVSKALLSGWITTGPRTKLFENKLTAYVGCRKTICLNSATAGMELMLRWFGVGPGDEVIIPAYTYCATANVVMHCGATPVMVDINEKDFNISVAAVEKAISAKTKVIMPVDISGFPADYDALNALVNAEKIKKVFLANGAEQKKLGRILILSDAAHSFGATMNGKMSGALTDVSVFSFHAVKNLTTSEGGGVCLNLPDQFDIDEIYQHLNINSLHGQSKDALAKTQVGNWRYDVLYPGYKCNMTDISAAIGLIELERYESNLARRKVIFDQYVAGFENEEWAIIPPYLTAEKETSYHLFLLRIKGIDEPKRDAIMQAIFEAGVSVNVHFQPLPLLTAYKSLGYKMEDYPVAWAKYENEITLPVYFDLSDESVQFIIKAVTKAVNGLL
ncbi:capsular biosynthesis protein [Putridiphycobacter roseus]|uniref:Capsular biosynthesis protein n=1 Tax=Putridiphycobacter roseus TaxID=2219161 RepID=A0A2W1MYK6_9FLAO|nr:DegT/DnrJ/EryC1/StrS aminotransferase family protein [Putridiphycobacter roseus]PZE16474.1 capsular biosynthesis protein [Putridiphycobacter roseus]